MWTPDMGFDRLERMVERDRESKYGGFILNGCWDDDEDEMVEIDVVDFEEEGMLCFSCDGWDPEDKHIYFVRDGKADCCCERCFRELIEEDGKYDQALMILHNRLGNNTGIAAVDLMADRLVDEIEKAKMAEKERNSALYQIVKMMKVGN